KPESSTICQIERINSKILTIKKKRQALSFNCIPPYNIERYHRLAIVSFNHYYFTETILTKKSPPGVEIFTSSFTFLPIKACAIGESLEILPAKGSDSALPTIVYSSSSPSGNSLKTTVLPIETSS